MSAFALMLAAVQTISVSPDHRFGAALSELDRIRAEHPADPVEIVVADGTYHFSKPLEIDGVRAGEGMGKLTIRAADGAHPRIVGGVPVKGWTRCKGKVNGRTDVWEADVSSLGLAEQQTDLFLDGRALTLARYPNADPKSPLTGGWAYIPGNWVSMYKKVEGDTNASMQVDDADWHDWKVPTEGRVVVFPQQHYGSSLVRVKELDREKKRIVFARNVCGCTRPKDNYILSGFREEMDEPGEWYHDLAAQKLYLIPPKGVDPSAAAIALATARAVFRCKGAVDVSIEGLEICAAKKALVVDGGRGVALVGCKVHDIMERAVELNRGEGHRLADCDFYDLGEGVMHCLGGAPGKSCGFVVENCYVHHIGRLTHSSAAFFLEVHGVVMRHNLMHDLPGWGVFHCGGGHRFEDNRIHHYMLETEDGAAFYTCNYMGGVGTVLARNWISDGIGYGKAAAVGPYVFQLNSHAFYFDAGPGFSTMYDNVIERTSGPAVKFNTCRGMVVSNNVFSAIGRRSMRWWSHAWLLQNSRMSPNPPPVGDCWSNVVVRNIWAYPDCPEQLYVLTQGEPDIGSQTIDWNWISLAKDEKTPRLFKLDWKKDWIDKGADAHSFVGKGEVAFRDPKHGDFTPKNKSVPAKLGMHPVVLKDCGLYVTKHRPKIPKEADGVANHPEWLRPPTFGDSKKKKGKAR